MIQFREVFKVCLKIVGVITIIWAIPSLFQLGPMFLSHLNSSWMMSSDVIFAYRFSLLIQTLTPVLLVALGYYLLKYGNALADQAFSRKKEVEERSDESGEESGEESRLLFIKKWQVIL